MVDVNKPVTNPELVKIMDDFLQEKNIEKEFALIKEIKEANFLVPIVFEGEIEDGILKKDSIIKFKLITNDLNQSFFPAFTDWDELGKWSKEREQALISTYDDLYYLVLNNKNVEGFVINPYNQNFIITREVMEYFDRRYSVVKKDTKVMLGQPADYPYGMTKALSSFFEKNKDIESAYLFLAHKEGEPKPNLMLIIETTGDESILFPKIAAIAQEFLAEEEYIDLVPLNSGWKNAIKDSTPFYKKKKWKLF